MLFRNARLSRVGVALVSAFVVPFISAAVPATTDVPGSMECTLVDGALSWGIKESFRSYISGSIAEGEWVVADGATYATPVFTFPASDGATDMQANQSVVAFRGSVQFSGHGGLLQTTLANPVLTIADGRAHLALDVASVPMEQAMQGDSTMHTAEQVSFVDVDLTDLTVTQEGEMLTFALDDAATHITADGFAAFGSYQAGTAFDAIDITVTAACADASAPAASEAAPTVMADAEVNESEPDRQAGSSWMPWALGGGVLGVIGVTWLLLRRRASAGVDARAEQES